MDKNNENERQQKGDYTMVLNHCPFVVQEKLQRCGPYKILLQNAGNIKFIKSFLSNIPSSSVKPHYLSPQTPPDDDVLIMMGARWPLRSSALSVTSNSHSQLAPHPHLFYISHLIKDIISASHGGDLSPEVRNQFCCKICINCAQNSRIMQNIFKLSIIEQIHQQYNCEKAAVSRMWSA